MEMYTYGDVHGWGCVPVDTCDDLGLTEMYTYTATHMSARLWADKDDRACATYVTPALRTYTQS